MLITRAVIVRWTDPHAAHVGCLLELIRPPRPAYVPCISRAFPLPPFFPHACMYSDAHKFHHTSSHARSLARSLGRALEPPPPPQTHTHTHTHTPPQVPHPTAGQPALVPRVYTVCVGLKPSNASHYLHDPQEVLDIIEGLSTSSGGGYGGLNGTVDGGCVSLLFLLLPLLFFSLMCDVRC